eukprot:gi/632958776/ref/XP_007895237.1/ PREDICTED: flap endonuclease GEN homolog 1 isoform X2 [Callorhinchus milii]
MGVHDLWQILEPVKEHVPLQNLSGKTLAVDMSLWVCEAQTVKAMMGTVIKPHLRNLFFRVSSLTLMGVKLIFVVEGNAPKLKAETMSKRNEARCGTFRKPDSSSVRRGRSHFQSILKECCELLDCLGIPWVNAAGEAEAMCAYLNFNGYVDGCISNDGDTFLYGAKIVYRNFTMNTKDPHVDCYKMSTVKSELGLERDSLIGLAILVGCDYLPKGVPGVGKEQAMKLIEILNGESLLQRFRLWKREFDGAVTHDTVMKKKVHCSLCQHPRSAQDQEHRGCEICGSTQLCEMKGNDYCCPCDWHQAEQDRKVSAVENNLKKKARVCVHFPFEEVIKEFLVTKDKMIQNIHWKRPNLLSIQNFNKKKMEWPKHYTSEKVLVLLTHHDIMERTLGKRDPWHLQPIRIVKTRIRNGIPCFEILWEKPENYVYSDDQSEDSQYSVTTIEDQLLFQAAYPDVSALFHRQKAEAEENKQKSKSKRKGKAKPESDELAEQLSQMNLQLPSSGEESNQSVQKRVNQRDNPIKWSHPNPIGSCTLLPKFSCEDPASEMAQIAINSITELGKANGEPLTLLAAENKLDVCALSPSMSVLVAELNLSGIDWGATSFGTPTNAQVASKITEGCCGSSTFTNELKEDKVLKVNTASSKHEPVQINTKQLLHKDMSGQQDPENMSLRDRILLKNSHSFFSLGSRSNSDAGHILLSAVQKGGPEFVSEDKPICNIKPLSNNKMILGSNILEKQHTEQEQILIHSSEEDATTTVKPFTLLDKQIPRDSSEKNFGAHSFQTLESNNVPFKLQKSKVEKPHREKLVAKNIQTKNSVCHKVYSSSDDSDNENSGHRKQKPSIKSRTAVRTVEKCSQAMSWRVNVKSSCSKAGYTGVNTGSVKPKVASYSSAEKNEEAQLMYNDSKATTANTSQNKLSAVCESSIVQQCKAVQLKSCPINVDTSNLSDGEDSVILIDSPLPLSERLKFRL